MVIYDIIFRAFSSCCFIITAHRIVLITIFFFSLAQQYPLNAPQTRPPRRRRLVGAQWRCVTIRFRRSSLLTSQFARMRCVRSAGHFERRISFGYDADLTQVRAEFDGEHLRITVPRRPAHVTYWGTGV